MTPTLPHDFDHHHHQPLSVLPLALCNEWTPKQAIASFQAPPEPPFELPDGKHIVDLRYLAESVSLVIVLAGGDIVVISLEEELLPDQEKVRLSEC